MARTKTHDKLLAKRRELNARKANGENVRDETRANEKLIRDSRNAGNRASDVMNATPARKRAQAPAKVDEPKPEPTKRTRKAAPKPDDTPEPPKSRKRKQALVVGSTTHTDADITLTTPKVGGTEKVDDRPADVIAAEAAWRDSRGSDGAPAYGSAYTMLKYAELEVVRLNHAIAKLKKQVMRDPKAAGITL